jgi:peptide deformylase
MIEIVQNDNPVLRKISKEVEISDITKPKIWNLLKDMSEALHSQDDGVAIAAPQVGESLRIFIVSGKIFDEDFMRGDDTPKRNADRKNCHPDLVFINPMLKKVSKDRKYMEEGCLSVRPIYGKVLRANKATIEAYDENGKKVIRGASGLLAQIFQHETDHLKGILFTDKAKEMYKFLPN